MKFKKLKDCPLGFEDFFFCFEKVEKCSISVSPQHTHSTHTDTHTQSGSLKPIVKECHIHTVSIQYLAEAERRPCPCLL